MAPADAQSMCAHSKMGDVHAVHRLHPGLQDTEGIGVCGPAYAGWKAQSALA